MGNINSMQSTGAIIPEKSSHEVEKKPTKCYSIERFHSRKGHRPMWKYYAILSAVFAALTAILAKCGIKGINSNLATAIRTGVILILTWSVVLCSGTVGQLRQLTWRNIAFLIASGIATGLSWLFYFKALQTGDVSRVAPIDKLSMALVILFGIVFLHEKISWEVLTGGGFILAGTMVLLLK